MRSIYQVIYTREACWVCNTPPNVPVSGLPRAQKQALPTPVSLLASTPASLLFTRFTVGGQASLPTIHPFHCWRTGRACWEESLSGMLGREPLGHAGRDIPTLVYRPTHPGGTLIPYIRLPPVSPPGVHAGATTLLMTDVRVLHFLRAHQRCKVPAYKRGAFSLQE